MHLSPADTELAIVVTEGSGTTCSKGRLPLARWGQSRDRKLRRHHNMLRPDVSLGYETTARGAPVLAPGTMPMMTLRSTLFRLTGKSSGANAHRVAEVVGYRSNTSCLIDSATFLVRAYPARPALGTTGSGLDERCPRGVARFRGQRVKLGRTEWIDRRPGVSTASAEERRSRRQIQ